MSKANFNLIRYRFEKIAADALEIESGVPHDMEMKFVVSFLNEAPEDCDFSISIRLIMNRINSDEAEEAVMVEARGLYRFEEDIEPYEVDDPLERTFAVSLLYGSMRPTVEAIISNIGFDGLSLPLTLPVDMTQPDATGNSVETSA